MWLVSCSDITLGYDDPHQFAKSEQFYSAVPQPLFMSAKALCFRLVRLFIHSDRSRYHHDISWTAWAISMSLVVNIHQPLLMTWLYSGSRRSRSQQAVEVARHQRWCYSVVVRLVSVYMIETTAMLLCLCLCVQIPTELQLMADDMCFSASLSY